MKFLCDRCKTRYSIGDERVRGKILKIRCKNCANVITVREGMSADLDAAPPEPAARPKKDTALAPVALEERNATAGDGPVTQKLGRPGAGGAATEKLGRSGAGGAATEKLGRSGAGGAATEKLGRPGDRGEAGAANRAGAARDPAAAGGRGAASAASTAGGASPAGAASPAGVASPAGAATAAARSAGAIEREAAAGGPARRGQGDVAPGEPGAGAGAAGGPARRGQGDARGEPVNARNAAFASATAKPPPAALEEEWYVSIDGEQEGPFSLADTQRWVAQQAFDAELHCWSEGFDDWLPVDKVSHFRGLRKRPAVPPAPPPLPRVGGAPRAAPAAPAAPADDEPKPLFAATMASLERGAPAMPTTGLGPPPPIAPARATPPFGSPIAPQGGTGGRNGVQGGIAPLGARPAPAPEPVPAPEASPGAKPGGRSGDRTVDRTGEAPAGNGEGPLDARAGSRPDARDARDTRDARAEARPGAAAQLGPSRLLANPFDVSEGGDAATQLEAMPFEDGPMPGREPRPEPRPGSGDVVMTAPHVPASSTLRGTGAAAAATTAAAASDFGSDDDLDIGEVSRVVNLADVSRTSRTGGSRAVSVVTSRATGAHAGVRPGLRATGAVPSLPGAGAPAAEGDPGMSMAPVVRAHRRGLIALLAVAGVMVLGVIGAVVVFVTRDDDAPSGKLGEVRDIDTLRPEDPVTHRPIGSASVPAPPTPAPPHPVPRPRPNPGVATGSQVAEVPTGGLASDEIEDVARKHQEMTQRCYMRSQRGADAILIGDVKKIAVTLTIDREGNVSELQLSEHGADTLGKCLSTAIRGWKFRQSAGGIYRFSLAFASG